MKESNDLVTQTRSRRRRSTGDSAVEREVKTKKEEFNVEEMERFLDKKADLRERVLGVWCGSSRFLRVGQDVHKEWTGRRA